MLTFHEQNYRFKKSDNKVNLFHFPSHFPVCHDHIVEFFMNSFINISVKTKRFGEIPLSIYLRYKKSCFCLNIRHCMTEFESYWDSRRYYWEVLWLWLLLRVLRCYWEALRLLPRELRCYLEGLRGVFLLFKAIEKPIKYSEKHC